MCASSTATRRPMARAASLVAALPRAAATTARGSAATRDAARAIGRRVAVEEAHNPGVEARSAADKAAREGEREAARTALQRKAMLYDALVSRAASLPEHDGQHDTQYRARGVHERAGVAAWEGSDEEARVDDDDTRARRSGTPHVQGDEEGVCVDFDAKRSETAARAAAASPPLPGSAHTTRESATLRALAQGRERAQRDSASANATSRLWALRDTLVQAGVSREEAGDAHALLRRLGFAVAATVDELADIAASDLAWLRAAIEERDATIADLVDDTLAHGLPPPPGEEEEEAAAAAAAAADASVLAPARATEGGTAAVAVLERGLVAGLKRRLAQSETAREATAEEEREMQREQASRRQHAAANRAWRLQEGDYHAVPPPKPT
ncbi:hypothetical protein EON68_01070 [archaeon]|nr:MAG: hypothetical protein EON68_01070 [archaeon]